MRLSRDLLLIYVAALVRAFGVGLLGVVVGVYLFRFGLNATRIGFVLAAGLAGITLSKRLWDFRGIALAGDGCLPGSPCSVAWVGWGSRLYPHSALWSF